MHNERRGLAGRRFVPCSTSATLRAGRQVSDVWDLQTWKLVGLEREVVFPQAAKGSWSESILKLLKFEGEIVIDLHLGRAR